MPNWVFNNLDVIGNERDVLDFVIKVGEGSILDTLLPLPDEATKIIELPNGGTMGVFSSPRDGGIDGYQLAVDTWGCKWPDSDTSITRADPGWVQYSFETPWSPPIQGFSTVSTMFPTLTFLLSGREEQPAWCGYIVFRNGTIPFSGEVSCDCPIPEPEDWDDPDFDEEAHFEKVHAWENEILEQARNNGLAALGREVV